MYLRLNKGQERGVKCVGLLKLVRVLAEEQLSLVDELAEDESEDLAEVETGNHLLERLLVRLVGRLVDDGVVLRPREVLVLERVERSPLAWRREGRGGKLKTCLARHRTKRTPTTNS